MHRKCLFTALTATAQLASLPIPMYSSIDHIYLMRAYSKSFRCSNPISGMKLCFIVVSDWRNAVFCPPPYQAKCSWNKMYSITFECSILCTIWLSRQSVIWTVPSVQWNLWGNTQEERYESLQRRARCKWRFWNLLYPLFMGREKFMLYL